MTIFIWYWCADKSTTVNHRTNWLTIIFWDIYIFGSDQFFFSFTEETLSDKRQQPELEISFLPIENIKIKNVNSDRNVRPGVLSNTFYWYSVLFWTILHYLLSERKKMKKILLIALTFDDRSFPEEETEYEENGLNENRKPILI